MGRQSRVVLGIAGVALLALMAVFAVELADSQSKAREDVQDRFRDRAKVSASLTESLFGSAGTSGRAENARRFGGARVSPQALTKQAKESRNLYALVLSEEGRLLAASTGTPAEVKGAVQAKPAYVRQALAGAPFALSGIQRAGLAAPALGYAQPFPTRFGRRVLIAGLSAQLIYEFLGGVSQAGAQRRGRAGLCARQARRPRREPAGGPPRPDRPGEGSAGGRGKGQPRVVRRRQLLRLRHGPGRPMARGPDGIGGQPLRLGERRPEVGALDAVHRVRHRGRLRARSPEARSAQRGQALDGQERARCGQQDARAPRRRALALQRGARAVRVDRLPRSPGAAAQGPDLRGAAQAHARASGSPSRARTSSSG